MTSFVALFVAILLAASTGRAAPEPCLIQELYGDRTLPFDTFAGSLASAGDVAVVGDPFDLAAPGQVYVYRRLTGSWQLETILHDPDQSADSYFYATATNGEVILVASQGVLGEGYEGIVHVYRHEDGRWNHEAVLHPPEGSSAFHYGMSRAIDGDVAVIAARDAVVNGFDDAGAVYVYRYDRARRQWNEEQVLHAFTPDEAELFGKSVDILGNAIVVGANGVNQGQGAAYVFEYNGTKWTGVAELTAFDGEPHDLFGWTARIGVGRICICAVDGDQPAGPALGVVYTYVLKSNGWNFEQKLYAANPLGPSTFFGTSIGQAVDGQTLLVGAPNDDFGAFDAGAVHIFKRQDGQWVEAVKLGDPTPNPNGSFGAAVVNGTSALIGALNGGVAGNGVVFVYDGITLIDCDDNGLADACEGNVSVPVCAESSDLDGDGFVGLSDLGMLLRSWGTCPSFCLSDLDGSGAVDGFDLAYLLGFWGRIDHPG